MGELSDFKRQMSRKKDENGKTKAALKPPPMPPKTPHQRCREPALGCSTSNPCSAVRQRTHSCHIGVERTYVLEHARSCGVLDTIGAVAKAASAIAAPTMKSGAVLDRLRSARVDASITETPLSEIPAPAPA